MFNKIKEKINKDNDFPDRVFSLQCYKSFLNGTFYDHLSHYFYQENDAGGNRIPLLERRPSVRYRLAKIVVEDVISLLFGDGHFPDFEIDDAYTRNTLGKILVNTHLNEHMINAAKIGSIGSVAILMKVLDGYVSFKPIETIYLTPTFNPIFPDRLISVREKYKVKGFSLLQNGYDKTDLDIDENDMYWMIRDWDENREVRYIPLNVKDSKENGFKLTEDAKRTTEHNLGFVPIVWIKNLPSEDDIDGECTFSAAIENNIEIDYQLSQLGRALRYTSDPMLIIKDDSPQLDESIKKGPNTALKIGVEGDAKYLELHGRSSDAVLQYVDNLRKYALENIHGNRTTPEKLAFAQSGRAIQLLYQPLIWLTDNMRVTYGKGLLQILQMIIQASHKFTLKISNSFNYLEEAEIFNVNPLNSSKQISLRWPAWFTKTTADKLQEAQSLKTLYDSSLISQESAIKNIAAEYTIQNVENEINKITEERKLIEQEVQAMKPQIKENINLKS